MLEYKIYENQKRTAEKVYNSLSLGNRVIHLVAPTQSGKTGTIIHLARMLSNDNFILTSGMMENHLFEQNSTIAEVATENVHPIKMHTLLAEPNPKKLIKDLNIKFIVIDECHYGIGKESRLDLFIKELKRSCSEIGIVWVGATGYQLVNSNIVDDTVQMEVPNEYFGVNSILSSNKIIDSKDFEYLSKLSSELRVSKGVDYGGVINESMNSLLSHLKSFDFGMGIVRVRSKESAHILKEALVNKFPYAKVIVAVSGSDDGTISDTIKIAKMISRSKRVILIVCQSLKAGIDLGEAKSNIRFIVETYKTCASVSQGLVGRICGYHQNSDCIVVADIEAMNLQASYENDYRVINDDFLSKCFSDNRKNLATSMNYSQRLTSKSDFYYKGDAYKVKSADDVNSDWFLGYSDEYCESVKNLMVSISKSNGTYAVRPSDHVSKEDRLNSIQSGKFKNRSQFMSYVNKMDDRVNFSSIFHRFNKTSEDRRGGGLLKGGVSNLDYAKSIKVGVIYDNESKDFYIVVRDKRRTKSKLLTKVSNKTIFNK